MGIVKLFDRNQSKLTEHRIGEPRRPPSIAGTSNNRRAKAPTNELVQCFERLAEG